MLKTELERTAKTANDVTINWLDGTNGTCKIIISFKSSYTNGIHKKFLLSEYLT